MCLKREFPTLDTTIKKALSLVATEEHIVKYYFLCRTTYRYLAANNMLKRRQ